MKRWLLAAACCAVALGLLLYPLVGELLSEKYHSDVETSYTAAIADTDDAELTAQRQAAQQYNAMLANATISEGGASAPPLAYAEQLTVGGVMAYIEIPKINVYLPVQHGTGAETLERAVGHVVGTSLPVGGNSTHAVLSAHSGMASSKLFSDIDQLTEGNTFYVHVLGDTLAYEVDSINIVLPTDTSLLQIEDHYTVVGEYIDRAISGTTDNRAEFQRMISDSDRHTFEGVLVYQLDRFARNRYDSAINKVKLKKNGVRVLSAKENIADDASGILVEGVLESMAEYYSVELSQKIHRGMAINAEKCLSNGSNPGLGFKVDAERRFYVDEEEAAIVREIYERYASGETKAEIIRDLKRRRVKTSLGKEFSPNSLSHLLSNKRYIGVYLYKGKETPDGMPRILDDDLFYRVQSMMNKNKNAPARTHGEGEYLLTTKLFCGHCKEMMVGYGGTSKTGRQYHYYMCKNARRKKCGKKIVSKSYIEDRVVNECLKMLTEEKIRFIAKKVAKECAKSPDNLTAKALKKAIREADTAIENLWKAIEQGRAVEMLTERLNKRMAEKAELEARLAVEENKKITLTEAQILAFLDYVCEMPANEVNKRRAIINIFVHSVYLYDDHFTLIINASKKPLSIDNIPLDDIETVFEGETGASEGYSSLSTPAPPKEKIPQTQRLRDFFLVFMRICGVFALHLSANTPTFQILSRRT